jgi:serine/threonine-protein kinase ULK/ATG1
VYEYCNGGDLETYLEKKGFLKEDEAMKILIDLIDAFKVLNKKSIIHRDIKPSNILIHNGEVKLGDFGFCKKLKHH